jgi:hypothetical protein
LQKVAASHAQKIYDEGQKIALVRELALQLGLSPELVADIQEHYTCKKNELEHIKRQGKLL